MAGVPDQLAQSVVILAALAVARWSTRKRLLRVVALDVRTFGCCDAASVTLLGILDLDGEVCTSAVAYRLDQAQRGGGGPCIDAVRFLQIFNVGCISTAPAWHDYRAAAAADGIRSSLSVPMTRGGAAIGRLNLYSENLDGFDGCEAPRNLPSSSCRCCGRAVPRGRSLSERVSAGRWRT